MINHKSTVLAALAIFLLALIAESVQNIEIKRPTNEFAKLLRRNQPRAETEADSEGTRWALLIAGSGGYWNYRHQADVCHAYQVLKKGGLKDENIVVFMYDDIANNKENPKRGIIVNQPGGPDVYKGVPKDYTGKNVTKANIFAALLGNASALTGGSGKVISSGPNDHIFIFFSDHGGSGTLGLPYESLYADELHEALRKKHSMKSYKSLLFYVEACEAGSMFDGLLTDDLDIYVTTASNSTESSYGTYCRTKEYNTCLGDEYSVSWLEDSDSEDRHRETVKKQYELVKERTLTDNLEGQSHVQQFGNLTLKKLHLDFFIGATAKNNSKITRSSNHPAHRLEQREADLHFFRRKVEQAPDRSKEQLEAQMQLDQVLSQRAHLDRSAESIASIVFKPDRAANKLMAIRKPGEPVVRDWNCLRRVVEIFEKYCGPLGQYGLKHMGMFANMCNDNLDKRQIDEASKMVCGSARTVNFMSNM